MELNISKSRVREELRKRWTDKAVELTQMGQWEEAIQMNMRIIELMPNDTQARNRLGNAYYALNRYEEAAQAYEENLRQHPSNPIARRRLTELYAMLQRTSTLEPEPALDEEDADAFDDDLDDRYEDEEAETGADEEID